MDKGKVITQVGAVVTAGGGALTVSGALASALGAPEVGAPAMAGGEYVAGVGANVTYVGIGMQLGGGALKWVAGGGPQAAVAATLHGVAAGANAVIGHFLPGLPDVLPVDPLDSAADTIGEHLGEATCH